MLSKCRVKRGGPGVMPRGHGVCAGLCSGLLLLLAIGLTGLTGCAGLAGGRGPEPAAPVARADGGSVQLRIESGMHTASITSIAVDRGERFVVTGSEDKTVRIWSAADGRALGVLRPPIAKGVEGQVFAVAISPDGRLVAAGGANCKAERDNRNCSVYLFDRASGRMVRRLMGLPNAIAGMTWSQDGRFLAAGLLGQSGLRIWRTLDWLLVREDREYSASTHGIAFAVDGKLVTTSIDGQVRIYGPGPTSPLLAKASTGAGDRPDGVAFSPDGARIAVGLNDRPAVRVLSVRDLNRVQSGTCSFCAKVEPRTRNFVRR